MSKKNTKYIVLMIISILVIALICFRKYIFEGYYFFNNSMLSDTIRANVPTYYHMYDTIKHGFSFWSWQMGIGTNMFSHADSIFDPFVYIVFIFGRTHIPRMLVWMLIIKLIAQGGALYAYLNYFNYKKSAIVIACCIYAFSGYSIIMGSNLALGTICVYLPLILLGTEKLMADNKVILLFASLFLTCVMSYYFFYVTAIGLAIYVLIRMYSSKTLNIKLLFKFLLIGILVLGCSMIVLIPQLELLRQSSRISGSAKQLGLLTTKDLFIPQIKTLITFFIRLISNDALGNAYVNGYEGETYLLNDYFGCATFSGSLFMYFLSILYYSKDKKIKKSVVAIGLMIVCFVLLPVFPFIFNAFSTINVRWMYWISIIESIVIAKSIDIMNSERCLFFKKAFLQSLILSMLITFVGCIVIARGGDSYEVTLGTLGNSAIKELIWIIFLYSLLALLHILMKYIKCTDKHRKNMVCIVCGIIILLDISHNYYWWLQSDYSVSQYAESDNLNYDDSSQKLITRILPTNKEFYRINKSFDSVVTNGSIPSENDAMVQGYYGLKNYNSLGNTFYIRFLQESGCYCTLPSLIDSYVEVGIKPNEVKGQEVNYINGVEDRYNLMSYLGVKYYLSKEDNENVPEYFKLVEEENGIKVYENKYNMPLLFCNQNLLSEEKYSKLSNDEKDIALLTSTIVNKEADINNSNQIGTLEEALNNVQKNQKNCSIDMFSNDKIRATIYADGGICSTTIPYDKNWKVYVDGKKVETQKVNIGFVGFDISEGEHSVKLKYELESFWFGLKISVVSIVISCLLLVCSYLVRIKMKKVSKRENGDVVI